MDRYRLNDCRTSMAHSHIAAEWKGARCWRNWQWRRSFKCRIIRSDYGNVDRDGCVETPDATLTQQPCYRTAKCCSPGDTIKSGLSFPARNFTIQAPECGQETGPLKNAREEHTAAVLNNGNVLVTGGSLTLNSAELYDPGTGTWTVTGALNTGRYQHTATLLPDGNLLIAGGYSTGYLSSAELYNPSSGSWVAASPKPHNPAEYHTATLLLNGKVLVTGGYNYGNPPQMPSYLTLLPRGGR